MMRSRRSSLLRRSAALTLLTFAGCAYSMVSGGKAHLQRAEQIYTDVQELRQLNFKTEVPLVLMSREQANLVLEREVTSHHDEARMLRTAEVGALTGLYAPGTGLEAQTMRVPNRAVAGFYDPEEREMILVEGKSQSGLWSEIAGFFTRDASTNETRVAHELTHALQDQYFGLYAALDRITDNDDRRLALKSVAEGDAMMIGYGYNSGRVDAETIHTMLTHLDVTPKPSGVESPDMPAALRDSLIFECSNGTRFVAETYQRGGWNAVNALYRDPSLSTRQVLDSGLYFGHAAPPLTITVGGWTRALKGWHRVAENTYGELLLHIIVTRSAASQAEARLARGWRGDRMVVLQKDGALTVIWIVALRDDSSAVSFASTYKRILEGIADGGAPVLHHVERRGTAVLAIIGPGAAQSAELAPAVWRASVIGAGA